MSLRRIPIAIVLSISLLFPMQSYLAGQASDGVSSSESPSIVALREAIDQGNNNAESRFWEHVQKVGTPLIEPAPGSRDNVLITFLWKGDAETRNVVLMNTAIASFDPAQSQLTRIPATNVWYRTYTGRSDARFTYDLSVNDDLTPLSQVTDWGKRTSTFHSDPMNPHIFRSTIMGGREISYVEGPKAPSERWITPKAGVPQGRLEQTTFASKQLGNSRELWVYTPGGLVPASPKGLPILLVFDGGEYVSSIPTPTILDNLIAAKKIPPMIAIFLANAPGEREHELNVNPKFADCIATELIPWLRKQYPISDSPDGNIVAGSSAGGLAAAFVAFKYPNLFGNVLSQSGAFLFAPDDEEEPEHLPRAFAKEPRRPIRFYLEVGTLESNREPFRGVNMVSSNRHFRDVLLARGYEVSYHEFTGGHSDLNWRGGFPEGLLALVGRQGGIVTHGSY